MSDNYIEGVAAGNVAIESIRIGKRFVHALGDSHLRTSSFNECIACYEQHRADAMAPNGWGTGTTVPAVPGPDNFPNLEQHYLTSADNGTAFNFPSA